MTEKELEYYEKIFIEIWDNNLLEKGLLMDMCQLLTFLKSETDDDNGITKTYYIIGKRVFVIEDDDFQGNAEIYEEWYRYSEM